MDHTLLPIEQVSMPADDVSDLRDVVDAINKLCETMKTSYDENEECEDVQDVNLEVADPMAEHYEAETRRDTYMYPEESTPESIADLVPENAEIFVSESWNDSVIETFIVSPEQMFKPISDNVGPYITGSLGKMVTEHVSLDSEPFHQTLETWSDTVADPVIMSQEILPAQVISNSHSTKDFEVTARNIAPDRFTEEIEPVASDTELVTETTPCEPMSDVYYTASSDLSLLSDFDLQDKGHCEDSDKEKDDRNSVIAGHVAAMRERFESMTRTNTPCPDLIRSASPSFEVFRNLSSSPDNLG